ncbi:hypothetical protein IMSAGC013_03479 [Lachnospiraceae bacterium]|nr:hypothetical protein IMSAGC013_03479 [Lachnospiraceae bacterium]
MKVCKNHLPVTSCHKVFSNHIPLAVDLCAVCLVNVCACCHSENSPRQFLFLISEAAAVPSGQDFPLFINGDCPKLLLVCCADPGCLPCLYGQCVDFAAQYISFRGGNLLYIVGSCHKRTGFCITVPVCRHGIYLIGTPAVRINPIYGACQLYPAGLIGFYDLPIADVFRLYLEIGMDRIGAWSFRYKLLIVCFFRKPEHTA